MVAWDSGGHCAFDDLRAVAGHANHEIHFAGLCGAGARFAVQCGGGGAQLAHFAGGEDTTRKIGGCRQEIDHGVERRGTRVVTVIDQGRAI